MAWFTLMGAAVVVVIILIYKFGYHQGFHDGWSASTFDQIDRRPYG